jgi:hypothetical protein
MRIEAEMYRHIFFFFISSNLAKKLSLPIGATVDKEGISF